MRLKLLAATAVLLIPTLIIAQAKPGPRVHEPVRADTSPPLRELIREAERTRDATAGEFKKPFEVPNQMVPDVLRNFKPVQTTRDPSVSRGVTASQAPDSLLSFDGFSNLDNITVFGGQVSPPDTNGDVGLDVYIQYINLGWSIFNKADGSLAEGPFAGNTFWAGFGGACETNNNGDPIVLYDELADRWLFSQFANPASAAGSQCFAVSTTSDPLGPYNRYEYDIPGIDYPKIGIFSDEGGANSGYYLTTNNFPAGFSGVSIIAADRDAMLAGDATATFVEFNPTPPPGESYFAVQPGHLEGSELPPAGTCNRFIMSFDDEVWGNGGTATDGFQVWEFCPDFDNPGDASQLTGPTFIASGNDWDMELCGFGSCIPQPGTAQLLDTLSQFTMYRAAMRFNPASAPGALRMVVSNTTDLGGDQAGLHWAELDIDTTITVADEGFYAPADTENRWLPSIAMDISGNIAMGYSKGSGATEPSIYFTGREATDPPGTMQAEAACVDGTGVQTGSNRWVDYSSISVDPVDDCTFWYTSEYYATTSAVSWNTRVCSFRFANCGVDRVVLDATSDNLSQEVCVGTPMDPIDLDVSLSTGDIAAVDMDFASLPAGVTGTYTDDPVDPTPGSTTANLSVDGAAIAGDFEFDLTGSSAGFENGAATVALSIVDDTPAESVSLLSPVDGILDIGTLPTFEWSPVDGASEYLIEILNFGGPVVAETVSDTTFTPDAPLEPGEYFWRVTAINACGEAAPTISFTFTAAPPVLAGVLLVDDDDNSPDASSIFAETIENLGLSFDTFDTGNTDTNEPDAATLGGYQSVVWFTGDNFGGATGPGAATEGEISTYLDNGGCMMMSSQDWTFAKAGGFGTPSPTPLMIDYFGLDTFGQDVGQDSVTGAGLFAGLGPYTLDYASQSLSNFSDELIPDAAAIAFDGDEGTAAIDLESSFNTVWLGFPFPALPLQADRDAVMSAFLQDRCGVTAATDIGDLGGTITISGTSIPVAGLEVTAERAGSAVTAITDTDGMYLFEGVAPGFYVVSVTGANIGPVDPVINVEVLVGDATTQDFSVDAAALAYDSATLAETLPADSQVSNPLTLSNLGTLPLEYAVNIGSYDFGLPAAPRTTSGHNNHVERRSSSGLSAALTSPNPSGPSAVTSAPGDFFSSAPFPDGSPLGITMSESGDIWVADLFSGNAVRYNESLFFMESIASPIGPFLTTGIAYDSVNGTLWWLDADFFVLVESFTDGTFTGNLIFLPPTNLPAGVEYDATTDAFYYVDIGDDDIYAVDRTGAVLPGYPVPQTDFDEGAGLFGNGLDVVDGKLDVLVGLIPEGQATRSVVTDLFGNNTGGETPLAAVPDTFINDVVRSRIDPNLALYVVGNDTSTIYAIEPINLALAEQWASVDVESGTIAPAGTADLELTFDSGGLPFGDYQAELNVGGNFVNTVPGKPLGLTVEPSPDIALSLTAYPGTDGGAQCLAGGGDEALDVDPAQALTYCIEVSNPGNTYYADPAVVVDAFGLDQSDMALLDGSLPLAPAASLTYSFVFEVPADLPATIEAAVTADPTEEDGTPLGTDTQEAADAVELSQANRAPEAEDQTVETDFDTPVDIVLTATDADGDDLVFAITSDPTNGVLSGSPPEVTYRSVAGFVGEDSFTFSVTDPMGESSEATVIINVGAQNEAPIANDQAVSTQEESPVAITLTGSDADDDPLTFAITGGPSNGTLSGAAPSVEYTPDAGFVGVDSFTFTVNDGTEDSAPATVTITVTELPNNAPTADSQAVSTEFDTAVDITLTGSDPDGDDLTFAIGAGPSNGVLGGTAPDVTYTPNAGYVGADSFTFTVNDGEADSAEATVSITVTEEPNEAPVADPQELEVEEDGSLDLMLTGSDADGDDLTFEVLSGPINGSVSGTAPDLTYTPNPNFDGADNIIFRVNDGLADSATATVLINVTPVNDPPTFSGEEVVTFDVGASGVNTEAGWATDISAGPNEDDQLLEFVVTIQDDADSLLSSVSVNAAGDLIADLTGATGEATVQVVLRDNGPENNESAALDVVIRVPGEGLFSNGFE